MNRILMIAAVALLGMAPAVQAQGVDIDVPMHFSKKLSGDQPLKFTAGGWAMNPKGARLKYRVIANQKDWKKVWSYLYDETVAVDFKKQRVLAIYKSPAKGGYTLRPKKVYNFEGAMKIELDVEWNGHTKRSHPFLFLVVDKFKELDVSEHFISPTGKEIQYP